MNARQIDTTKVQHTLLYFGPFDPNFRSLSADTATYIDNDDTEHVAEVATKMVTGLQFRYMSLSRTPAQNFVVGVNDVVLRAPILLIHERHVDGKWFAADSPCYFEDDSAMHLLVDMIVANPEYRDGLGRLLRKGVS